MGAQVELATQSRASLLVVRDLQKRHDGPSTGSRSRSRTTGTERPGVDGERGWPLPSRGGWAVDPRPPLDAGSCNGCDWEIAALLNPVHDVQRLGIDFVASPRHADLLLVTGVMTRNLERPRCEPTRRCPNHGSWWRWAPAPSAAASSPGLRGARRRRRSAAVDVSVPGCPPRPEALIQGLLMAMGRLEPGLPTASETGGATLPGTMIRPLVTRPETTWIGEREFRCGEWQWSGSRSS